MDWNADGYKDILVGDREGYVTFFQRNSNGSLRGGKKLSSNLRVIDTGLNSAPDFADLDNDGDLDMILGSYTASKTRIYMNTGTAASYQFRGYTEFPSVYYGAAYPSFCDMNRDGLIDVVIGSTDKKFHYFENTGTLTNPSFAADRPLQYQDGTAALTALKESRPEIADWNNDGFPDIISGSGGSDKSIYLYLAIPPTSVEENHSGAIVASGLSIGENPVRTNLSVSFDLAVAATSDFTVYNVNGRVELTHATNLLERGYNTVTIPNSLPNGTYVLRCTTGNSELAERFVVVR